MRFHPLSRMLHWFMAALILPMLFIGVGMVSSLSNDHRLVEIHKPLGGLILILAVLRLINRLVHPAPALPKDMPFVLRFAAGASHWMLYGLMIGLPLVGWAMLSAQGYPVILAGLVRLPAILPQNVHLFALLRHLHGGLAYLLFAAFLVHLGAALAHALISYLTYCVSKGGFVDPDFRVLFLNIIQLQDMSSPIPPYMNDGPLWSLSYEWVYYILYAIVTMYLKDCFRRYVFVALSLFGCLLCLAGPGHFGRVFMYGAVWWAGVELCQVHLDGNWKRFALQSRDDPRSGPLHGVLWRPERRPSATVSAALSPFGKFAISSRV